MKKCYYLACYNLANLSKIIMSFEKKNITYFSVWFLLFIVFLFLSFNASKNKLDTELLNSITRYSIWFNEFSLNNISLLDENANFEGKNIVFKNSLLNSIYCNITDSKKINLELKWDEKIFNIWEGLFLFDLNDPSFNYKINWNWFSADILSLWKIFIDTTNPKNFQIFPLSSTLNVSLMDTKNKFMFTNLYLYPHMNFYFDISRNSYLKKADLYRISSIDKVSYIKANIYASDKKINPDFEKEFFVLSDLKKKEFFETTMNFINSEREKSLENYNDIKNAAIYNFSGISYVKNYFSFLLNKEKKSIYYKNLILEQLKDLFIWTDKNESLISDISNNMNLLKDISENDYIEMENIIKWFYMQLSYFDNTDDYNAELNFYKLISNLSDNNKKNNDLEIFFYLNTFYSSYDTNSFKNSFYSYFNSYINEYLLNNLWIELWKNSEFTFNNKNLKQNLETTKLLDYFSFLLYNILISSFDLNEADRDNMLFVTRDYLLINNLIIKTIWDEKRTLSQVYYNNELANKILNNFKQIYFTWQRDENKLLILKEDVLLLNFTIKQFDLLNSIFVMIDKFYKKNYAYLDTNNSTSDKLVDDSYKLINADYDEYILAAKDYESYTLQYDETKRNLLWTKTINEGNSEIIVNSENFKNYIKIFNSVDYSQISLNIVENHYEVKNMFIAWIPIDFTLYPRELNRITNVTFNWKKIAVSYKLDNVKENLDEQYKNATEESEKEKYDFRNFFINTFINKQIDEKQYYEDDTKTQLVEDKAIVILKKDKLLWDKWEFSIISDILPIRYDNISVVEIDNNYDISISGVNMIFPLDETWWNYQNLLVEFSSKYIFTNTEHKFTKISVKFLDENTFSMTWEKIYLFDGKSFDLPYNLDIKYFADRIKPAIRKIYNQAISN